MKLSLKSLKLPFGRKGSLDARRARSGYLFTLPFILGIVLVYLPILIDSIWYSFNREIPAGDGKFTLQFMGWEYYQTAFSTPAFTEKLLEGVQQLVFEVPAIIIFALFIAVVLNQKMLGRAAFRAIFFVPVIISTGIMETVNAADIMQDIMADGASDGAAAESSSSIISTQDVQALLESMNLDFGADIITYIVNLVENIYNIINYSGVQMLIFLAGLQSISPAIYEACTIDGATAWETFWKVTFPMISPMILVNAAYTIIDSFTRSTNPVMLYINNYGSGGTSIAMSWIYFLLVMLIIGVVVAIASSFIFYQRRD